MYTYVCVIGCSHQFRFLTLREIHTENEKTKLIKYTYIHIHTHPHTYISEGCKNKKYMEY